MKAFEVNGRVYVGSSAKEVVDYIDKNGETVVDLKFLGAALIVGKTLDLGDKREAALRYAETVSQ